MGIEPTRNIEKSNKNRLVAFAMNPARVAGV